LEFEVSKSQEYKVIVFKGVIRPKIRPVSSDSRETFEGRHDFGGQTHYSIISQSREELDVVENSPSISMWPYLVATAQTDRLNEISVYSERGMTQDKMRFLYMNDFALVILAKMGREVKVMGRLHRPPRGAAWSFGMPFSA
jgi:hypothetical protein